MPETVECAWRYDHCVPGVQRGCLITCFDLTPTGHDVEDFLDVVRVRANFVSSVKLVNEHGELR